MQLFISVVLVCLLLVIVVNIVIKLRYNRKVALSTSILKNNESDLKYKIDFITRRLGFNPYDEDNYVKMSQVFNILVKNYNTNIYHYVLYNHINSLKTPGSGKISAIVPVETMYNVLSNISRKHELVFKYR